MKRKLEKGENINKFIESLLEKCQITQPPVDVKKIAEFLKIIVVERSYKDKGPLSGMLVRNQNKVIIGINESHNDEKKRFSIAHEIAHYFLHEGEELIVDNNFLVNFRHKKTNPGEYHREKDANYFASCLLIPDKFLFNDLKTYQIHSLTATKFEEISKDLHKKYNVSLITMRLRIYSLFH
ncbi:MAG TPA: ImmA/IrrE family metallo-endopeptidase [Methylomirabilota bacterium]|nr:ImmA/IrrE family metallo-endopeptidase [Methylomirabilota bacterium]